MNIVRQPQLTNDTCVSACIAMLIDRPVADVIEDFHKPFSSYAITIPEYLESNGVQVTTPSDPFSLFFGKVYILLVPSVNQIGMFHQVLADTRDGTVNIIDPARETQLSVSMNPRGDKQKQLLSWYIQYEVSLAPALGIPSGVN